MQINPKTVKKQFEKSLTTYNENAVVQNLMAEKLVNELVKFRSNFESVLELGCGAGLLTKKIVENVRFSKYFANDLVENSEKYVKSIVPEAVFYCGNAQRIKPSRKVDLIVSNAMFQWIDNLSKISENCKNSLNPSGILAFTSFSPENYKEIKDLTGLSLEYKTFDAVKEIFEKDFEIIYSEEFRHTMNFSSPLEVLAHMKNTGVNSLNSKHWTVGEVKEFCAEYMEKYPQNPLTYAGMIFICKR